MLSQTIYSLGDPGTFDITDKDNPQYYVARLSHELSENLYNLQTAGFDFNQMENSDYASFETAYDTYLTTLATWFDTAVQDSMDGDPIAAVPVIPDITAIVPWLGQNPWLTFLAKVALDMGIRWLRKKLDSDTDAKEITQVLRQALIGEIDSTEYPLIELLANIPIEIILSRYGKELSILHTSRP
ncbi:MAG: hypothetical protein V3V31_03790 [Methylococcales bacterium]